MTEYLVIRIMIDEARKQDMPLNIRRINNKDINIRHINITKRHIAQAPKKSFPSKSNLIETDT